VDFVFVDCHHIALPHASPRSHHTTTHPHRPWTTTTTCNHCDLSAITRWGRQWEGRATTRMGEQWRRWESNDKGGGSAMATQSYMLSTTPPHPTPSLLMWDGGEFPHSFDATGRGNPPHCVCLFLFNATGRGNPPCPICLFLFDAMRRVSPPRHVCLIFYDAMRRGNPPRCVCLLLFDVMRRRNPPRCICLLFFDATRHIGKLHCKVLTYHWINTL